MSTQIKNTLFRFTTLRAPELIEEEKINANFVKHPEQDKPIIETFDSLFLQAVYRSVESSDVKTILNTKATVFKESAVALKEDLYKKGFITKSLYDFAIWLSKNRSTLDYQQVMAQINPNTETTKFPLLEGITDPKIVIQLWDNLFYQIITNKSSYIREMILSVLVADFFLKNIHKTEKNTIALQKLAQARIIIPKILVEQGNKSTKNSIGKQTHNQLPVNTKKLDQHLDLILLDKEVATYKKMLSELKKQQAVYHKANQKAFEETRKRYDLVVAELYNNAQKVERTYTDPVTKEQKIVTEYVNLEIPSFEFEKAPELHSNLVTAKGTTEVSKLLNELIKANDFETFEEIIANVEQTIAHATQYLLNSARVEETLVNAYGMMLPVVDSVVEPVFSIAATTVTGKSALTLLFSDSVNQLDIIAANYTITFNDQTSVSNTSFSDTFVNNRLSIDIFTKGLSFYDKSEFSITGNFTQSDGSLLQFKGMGTISEITPDFQKQIPILTDYGYQLYGNGNYAIQKNISTGNSTTENGSTVGGNTTNQIPINDYIPSGFGIKQVGILDYRKVEQEVCCYVPGEVSHIENIMANEYKDRTTRALQRREETNTYSNETESEKLTDTTTSNRFEMNQEVASVLAEDTHFGMQGSVRQDWTGGGMTVGADFATNTSKEESNNQAVTMAKEVTERALDRIVLKTKEERIVKVTNEFEETNTHGVDNRKNNNHISGVYRWVDKVYRNKVVNYGKRLIYEFMIPEPAAFHNLASTITNTSGEVLVKPIDPRTIQNKTTVIDKIEDLDWAKASYWAKTLNVTIEKLPDLTINHSVSFHESNLGLTGNDGSGLRPGGHHFDFSLPERYYATSINGNIGAVKGFFNGGPASGSIDLMLANSKYSINLPQYYGGPLTTVPISIDLLNNQIRNQIGLSFICWDIKAISGNLIIKCQLTPEAYKDWQIKTFNAIIQAYEIKLAEYNQKLKQLRSEIKGTNPGFYRQIENTVLRKNCIEYLNSHNLTGINPREELITGTNSVTDFQVKYDTPELEAYAARVKFFEQAFEWNNISYNFYPMYWGEKAKLQQKYNVDEYNDPIFRAFLQSGMARVMVTVRPGFEEAVNWYMTTGQIWNGGQVPAVNDPLFLSIVEELRDTKGEVEETWETRVPTSLTIIQAGSAGLEVTQALPCDEDCEDNMLFDSDGNVIGKNNPFILKTSKDIIIPPPPYGGGESELPNM